MKLLKYIKWRACINVDTTGCPLYFRWEKGKDFVMTLYVSDLDGTLLTNNGILSEYSRNSLKNMIGKGLMFTTATARSLSAKKLLKGSGITLLGVHLNGVLIYDYGNEKYVNSISFDIETARKVQDILVKYDRMSFVYFYDDGEIVVKFEKITNKVEQEFFDKRKHGDYKNFSQIPKINLKDSDTVIYFTMVDEYERLEPIYNEISKINGAKAVLYLDNYSNLYFLEVFSSNANKANGVQYIKNYYKADKIIAFGDNLNDIEMLELSDKAIVVEDAVDKVKEFADEIIGKSYEDGVVKYLEKLESYN